VGEPSNSQIVARVIDLLREHYVFPDVGERVAERLAAHAAGGRYAQADPARLAALVTEDLQWVNGDRHLRLLHWTDQVPDETSPQARLTELTDRAEATAYGVGRVERLAGNVGYLELTPMLYPPSIAGTAVAAALTLVAPTAALLLDLRRCHGGDPDMVVFVCSHLLGPEPVHLNDWTTRGGTELRQFWSLPYVPGRRFGPDKPLWVLTSPQTFSGGEGLSYELQQLGRATLVGERTRGGAHPRAGFRVHPHLEASIPVARSVHPVTGTNWEGTGVRPDVEVPTERALTDAYRLALAGVLEATPTGAMADEARRALADLNTVRTDSPA
jgi:C-terminal processing protease CtpA/Prc